jgi:hypothetical protein
MSGVRAALIATERPRIPRVPSLDRLAWPAALTVLLLAVGTALQDPSRVRLAVALVAVVFLVGVATRSPIAGLLALLTWLVALGMTRRLVSELAPITRTDPLLLVSPFLLVLLAGAAIRRGAFRDRSALTNGVLALSLLTLLGAVNPVQGSLVGGISGLLFVLMPMLAFWIGRSYVDDRALRVVMKLVGALGVAAAVYGLLQTTSGFPSWDQQWISDVTYAALDVNGVIRPFAMFSSSAEYGMFLGLSIVIWLSMGRRLHVLPLTLAAIAVLVPALVLESARGAVIGLVATLGVLLGAHSRFSIPLSLGVGVLLLVALVFGLRHYGPATYGASTTGALLSHQVQGLSDPLNPQTSTAGVHLAMLENGVKQAFSQPAGQGLGTVTIAGAKFGGLSKGTETDPSNAAVALGLPGLLAYLVVFVSGMLRVYRIARLRRDGLALAALGVVVLTALQWLNGGQYAVAVLPWLVLGWADRTEAQEGSGGESKHSVALGL